MSELPKLKAHAKNGDGSSVAIQKKQIQKLEAQMEEYRQQEETQYELLETKKYTQELFDKRNAALRQKMEDCEKKIASAKQSLPTHQVPNACDYCSGNNGEIIPVAEQLPPGTCLDHHGCIISVPKKFSEKSDNKNCGVDSYA